MMDLLYMIHGNNVNTSVSLMNEEEVLLVGGHPLGSVTTISGVEFFLALSKEGCI